MAASIRSSGKQIELFCIDTWMGSEEHVNEQCVQSNTLYDEFLSNTQSFKDIVRPVRLPSVKASENFEDDSCDFIFIDAAHDYENVVADIDAWLPKLKANGVLAGHVWDLLDTLRSNAFLALWLSERDTSTSQIQSKAFFIT